MSRMRLCEHKIREILHFHSRADETRAVLDVPSCRFTSQHGVISEKNYVRILIKIGISKNRQKCKDVNIRHRVKWKGVEHGKLTDYISCHFCAFHFEARWQNCEKRLSAFHVCPSAWDNSTVSVSMEQLDCARQHGTTGLCLSAWNNSTVSVSIEQLDCAPQHGTTGLCLSAWNNWTVSVSMEQLDCLSAWTVFVSMKQPYCVRQHGTTRLCQSAWNNSTPVDES
jgi:hypothetical protein